MVRNIVMHFFHESFVRICVCLCVCTHVCCLAACCLFDTMSYGENVWEILFLGRYLRSLNVKNSKSPQLYQMLSVGHFGELRTSLRFFQSLLLGEFNELAWALTAHLTSLHSLFLKNSPGIWWPPCALPTSSLLFSLPWNRFFFNSIHHSWVCLFSVCPLASHSSFSFSCTTFCHSQRA